MRLDLNLDLSGKGKVNMARSRKAMNGIDVNRNRNSRWDE